MIEKEFINNLFFERSDYKHADQAEMAANLLDTISSDIYSESQRFVFELIQNADDSAFEHGNEVNFDFYTRTLVISHNGQQFSQSDISSLTSAGSSTKIADPTKTGYKGIGFKSVFGKSECVTIFSKGYQFRFDKKYHQNKLPWQVIPIWTEISELPSDVSHDAFKDYNVSTLIDVDDPDKLDIDLEELLLSAQILLFLRKITKISVLKHGVLDYFIEKKITYSGQVFNETSLLMNDKVISSWIVKTFELIPIPIEVRTDLKKDDETPKKLQEAEFTELTFAASVSGDDLKSLDESESLIFTYLPTKVANFKFPFLLNGSFITSASREALHEDRFWNQWLMQLGGEKLITWLSELAGTKYRYDIIKLLPEFNVSSHDRLKSSFVSSAERHAKQTAFVPSIASHLKPPIDLIIDKTGLSRLNFLAPGTVVKFLNKTENKSFQPDSFVHPELKFAEKLRQLGAHNFDVEHLETFFVSDEFRADHLPDQNFSLIEYFQQKAVNDPSGEWNTRLKGIPFIYTSEANLKTPIAVCFPSIAYTTEFGASVTVIHEVVYEKLLNNLKTKNWLEKLGVQEPSDISYLENEIIGNIDTCITLDNYLNVTRYLFNLFLRRTLTDRHFEKLRRLRLFTTSGELNHAEQCYLSDFYQPALRLEKIHNALTYVFAGYKRENEYISEWKTFFLKIGVVEDVQLQTISLSKAQIEQKYPDFGEYFSRNSTQPYTSNAGNLWLNAIYLYRITTYSLMEFSTELEFSKLFWEAVIKGKYQRVLNDQGFANYQNTSNLKENFFEWCLTNAAIFPTNQNTCVKACEAFINDKDIIEIVGTDLPVFYYKGTLSEVWKNLLPFKRVLTMEDYLLVLNSMAEQYQNGKIISKGDQKRLMLIYNKLQDLLPNLSQEKKDDIKKWAETGFLPATNLQFESIRELKHVNIVGFRTSSEKLKVLLLPENLRMNNSEFNELLNLLGIDTINEFKPSFGLESPLAAINLKNQLSAAIPFLAAIIEKRKFADFTIECLRMNEIVEKTEFYNAKDIYITFLHDGGEIIGSPLNIYRGNNKFYFKGKWNSPLTMFYLAPELTNMLDAMGFNEDLRLLLELPINEIKAHFIEQGIDIHRQEFDIKRKFTETLAPYTPIFSDNSNVDEPLEEAEYQKNNGNFFESFIPSYPPRNIDTSNIKVSEKTFGEILLESMEPEFTEIQNEKVRSDVGLWCEEFVYEFLKNETALSDIIWVNEGSESGLPYDFTATDGNKKVYIDVKGTPSTSKDIIYLSRHEWIFMREKGENYSVYRVYNAGNIDANIDIVANLHGRLLSGDVVPHTIALHI